MPSLGADMEAGILSEWKVKAGDIVARGDIIAVVETEKADIEVEVFEGGVIEALLVEAGTKVPVGTPLALIGAAGGAAPSVQPPEPVSPVATEHRPSSPLARKRARELGLDLATIHGTGPGGAITRADVEREAERPGRPAERPSPIEPHAARGEVPSDRMASMRHAIGAAMARSKREIPHYYLSIDIDLTTALAFIADRNAGRPPVERILPAVLLLKAVARAIPHVPEMNGFFTEEAFHPAEGIHLGVAISLREGGLIAPAIHDVDQLDLDELMRSLRDLVARARQGRLRSSEMTDATITVTNLGDLGVREVFGVIYPPQVALVGFGRVTQRPWAVEGLLGVKPIVVATLSADHRASDGRHGGLFLAAIERYLQRPEDL